MKENENEKNLQAIIDLINNGTKQITAWTASNPDRKFGPQNRDLLGQWKNTSGNGFVPSLAVSVKVDKALADENTALKARIAELTKKAEKPVVKVKSAGK